MLLRDPISWLDDLRPMRGVPLVSPVLGLTAALSSAVCGGQVLHVDDDAPADGDGLSWTTPYRFLQDALEDAANSGGTVDEIRVAGGLYRPDRTEIEPEGSGDRAAAFALVGGVRHLGGYAGFGTEFPDERNVDEFQSVLSGDLLGDDEPAFVNNEENSYHVVTAHDVGNSAVLEGFTVTAGNADRFDFPNDRGGGLYGEPSSATIVQCRFRENTAGSPFENEGGGGIYINGGSPVIDHCTFDANEALGRGGGIHARDAEATVTSCVFARNVARGKQGDGGGMTSTRGAALITNGIFHENQADFGGGGFCAAGASVSFQNGLFVANSSDGGGGVAAKFGGSMSIMSSTFSLNSGGSGGGGGILGRTTTRAVNCVLWGNVGFEAQISGPVTALYSTIEGGWPGEKVLDADPLFVDPVNADYRLSAESPCRNRGNNWGVAIDVDDHDRDGSTAELFPTDLDGNPRFVGGGEGGGSGPSSSEQGCGVPVIVDMGAYELQDGDPVEIIFADINGDGLVGMVDLVLLLTAWGADPENCVADLNVDLRVDHEDLIDLLAYWSP